MADASGQAWKANCRRLPCKHGRFCRSRPSGFTLVELLVSMVIIAILAGLLLPIAKKIRENAQKAVCQSNLRQLMLAFHTFAEENNEQLPGSYWDLKFPQNDPNPLHWDWLCGNPNSWSSAPAGGTLWHYTSKNPSIYRCPELILAAPAPASLNGPGYGSNGQYDYVSMLAFTGARLSHIGQLSRLAYPDGHVISLPTPIIVEGSPTQLNGIGIKSWHASTDAMATTHDAGGHYAAIDGSVQFIIEPPGGCSNWSSPDPSGRLFPLSPFPVYWGNWNIK